MTFNNRDEGMPHSIAPYTDASGTTKVFAGEIGTGPKTVTEIFTTPADQER